MRGLTQPRDDADLALRRPNRSSTVVRMRILASRILDASCIPEKITAATTAAMQWLCLRARAHESRINAYRAMR